MFSSLDEAIEHNADGVTTRSMIAQWTQTEPHNITTLIRRMQKDELIRAERNEKDKRFVSITISDNGREVLNKGKPTVRDIVMQVMSSFGIEDID